MALLILSPKLQQQGGGLPEELLLTTDSNTLPAPEPSHRTSGVLAAPSAEAADKALPEDSSLADPPDSIDVLDYLDRLDMVWDTAYWEEDSLDDYRVWRQESDSLIRPPHRVIPEDIRTAAESPEVLTDILLYQREIPVMEEVRDSVGQIILKETADSPINVTFWESPLNYRGYRKGGNNLVLFGVYAIDSVRLFRSGPHLYLDVLEDRFLITETYEFKHLIEMSRKKSFPR